MTTATISLNEIAAFWRTARRLYPVFTELNRSFEIGLPLCTDLEYPIDRSEPEVIARASKWFDEMDSRTHTWQLRQLLQSTNLQTEENLCALAGRYMQKDRKTDSDRDKIDFLLVQYFAHCAPQVPYEQHLELSEVARVLEPILGEVPTSFPAWSDDLNRKLDILNHCNSLEELQKSNALVDVRESKLALGDRYLEAAALVCFTRFNFLARRAFFRAMHLDLHAIRGAMNALEARGVTTIDCREAGLTQQETLENLRHVVHQWKTPFRAPYSGGNSFLPLVVLRQILQAELDRPAGGTASVANPAPVAAPAVKPASGPLPVPKAQPAAAMPAEKPSSKVALDGNGKAQAPAVPAAPAPAVTAPEPIRKPLVQDSYLEQCIVDITKQIQEAPPKNGAGVTPIVLAGCKLLIATWEGEAFTKGADDFAAALQRAVAARTILYVAVERHKKKEPTDLFVALEIAHRAAEQMREQVARAKDARNIDAAVNLAATTKRLLALIAEAEKLCK
jgi:hypothetical protein